MIIAVSRRAYDPLTQVGNGVERSSLNLLARLLSEAAHARVDIRFPECCLV
jgi:hypothetical protein